MFENIDKKKNRKNAILGLILILIPMYLYFDNKELKLPSLDNITCVETTSNMNNFNEKITDKEKISMLLKELKNVHGKYLTLGNDGTKTLLEININMDNGKSYVIECKDSTIKYNNHLYDISPENYTKFLDKFR